MNSIMATALVENEMEKQLNDFLGLKLVKEKFSAKAQALFEKYENPFEFCSLCMFYCAEEHFNEENGSLPVRIISEFNKFLKLNSVKLIDSPLLTEGIQKRVFNCLFLLEPWEVKRSLIKSFGLRSVPEVLVTMMPSKIKEGRSLAHLCDIIEYMKCGAHINVDNVLLPLFLLDHYEIIEELLTRELCENSSASNLKVIVNNICNRRYQLSDLKRMYNIKVSPLSRHKHSEIQNFGYRLQAHARNAHFALIGAHKNTVAYLFRMHYKKNAITLETLVLYSADLAKHDRNLMNNFILKLFNSYEDYLGAKMYWDKVRGSKVEDHSIVVNLKNRNYSPKRRPVHNRDTDWYKLDLPLEDIINVVNKTQYVEAIAHLQNSKVIAMDLEWKSANRYDDPEKISLLQIATQEKVYLMDMNELCRILKDDSWKMLGEIFSDINILKLAYHRAGDDNKLKRLSRHLARMNNCFDLHDISISLLENHPSVYSYKTVDYKGLSGLVYLCFGKPLDKMEQCSYWDLRPLTTSQVIYAALDAYCLIDIYNYFNEKSEKLDISDWKELKCTEASGSDYSNNLYQKKSKNIIKDPKFVCDNMLQKLYQLMLSKNIDTELVNIKDGHDKCFEFYENERRIILTNKIIYRRMRCFVLDSHIHCIEESDVQKQLAQVQSHFCILSEEITL